MSADSTARTRKIPRHDVTVSTWAPASGARIGARPMTMMSDENRREAAAPEYRSRTTALTMTMAPAPARPCTNRNAISTTTLGASEQSTEAIAYVISAATNGSRRPKRSLSGPISSWPSARPVTHAVNVSCTTESLVSNPRASSGNAGRYMSIDSGPIAITAPRTITSPTGDELKRGRLR